MKSLLEYILESQIIEKLEPIYSFKRDINPISQEKFRFKVISGHGNERSVERRIKDREIISLIKDCWSRIKVGYESGKYIEGAYNSKRNGSVLGLHSTERTEDGYLTIILYIKKYHPDADYFELEVVTVCKTKTMDGWKEKTEDGKTLNHPERGQLNLWDQEGIKYRGKQDD